MRKIKILTITIFFAGVLMGPLRAFAQATFCVTTSTTDTTLPLSTLNDLTGMNDEVGLDTTGNYDPTVSADNLEQLYAVPCPATTAEYIEANSSTPLFVDEPNEDLFFGFLLFFLVSFAIIGYYQKRWK